MNPRQARLIEEWERQGVEATRLTLHTADTWSSEARGWAIVWLAEKDQQRLDRADAATAEQLSLTRRANRIAKQGRDAAIGALLIAAIGTLAAVIGLFAR